MEELKKPQSTSFKTCSKCGFVWPGRLSFLSDPQLRIVGYQVDFDKLKAGLFLFNHSCPHFLFRQVTFGISIMDQFSRKG